MADLNNTGNIPEQNEKQDTGIRLVLPFLAVLAILTVVSFIIPLRPTRSQMEKRELAAFPEFTWEVLAEGSYFDDITTWFSDTFPGREEWLTLSSRISELHGHSEISIAGELPAVETMPQLSQEPETPVVSESETTAEEPDEAVTETTEETQAGWGGVDAADDAAIELGDGAVIQIGDSAFNAVGFSQVYSERYAKGLSQMADNLAEEGIHVVSAPAPTAIGILVEKEYLEKLNSVDQDEVIRFMHDNMSDNVVKVDTYDALIQHNDEYIYFRTDHHWTALGAYYVYEAICNALGMEPVALEDFEEWDQGEMEGSLYWRSTNPRKLRLDNIYTYLPPYEVSILIHAQNGSVYQGHLVQDVTNWEPNAKYSAFICSDNPLSIITNHDLKNGKKCILVKDSFGNALAPFLAASYEEVHVVDYRKYHKSNMEWYAKYYGIDDVIFSPYVIATQAKDGTQMLGHMSGTT